MGLFTLLLVLIMPTVLGVEGGIKFYTCLYVRHLLTYDRDAERKTGIIRNRLT
jgi:hypothetical protein